MKRNKLPKSKPPIRKEIVFEGKTYKRGQFVVMHKLPNCDICVRQTRARYDARYIGTSWAYQCRTHWMVNNPRQRLGVGIGQILVTEAELKAERSKNNADAGLHNRKD